MNEFDWPKQSEVNRIYIFLFLDWIWLDSITLNYSIVSIDRLISITIRFISITIRLSSIIIRLGSIIIRLSSIKYLLWAN